VLQAGAARCVESGTGRFRRILFSCFAGFFFVRRIPTGVEIVDEKLGLTAEYAEKQEERIHMDEQDAQDRTSGGGCRRSVRRIPLLWNSGCNGSAAAADGMGCCGMLCGGVLGTGLPTGLTCAAAKVCSMVLQPFASIIGNDYGK
jgi:hypothetical protein